VEKERLLAFSPFYWRKRELNKVSSVPSLSCFKHNSIYYLKGVSSELRLAKGGEGDYPRWIFGVILRVKALEGGGFKQGPALSLFLKNTTIT